MKRILIILSFFGVCRTAFGQAGTAPTGTGIDPRTQLKKGSTTVAQFLKTDTVAASPTAGQLMYVNFADEVNRVIASTGLNTIVVAATAPLTSTYNSGTKTYTVAAPNATVSTRGLMFDSTAYFQRLLTASNGSVVMGGTLYAPTISSPDQTVSFNSSTGDLTLTRNATTAQTITITGTVSVRSTDLALTNGQTGVTFTGMGGYTRYEVYRDGRLLSTDDFTTTTTTTNLGITLNTAGYATEKMYVIAVK